MVGRVLFVLETGVSLGQMGSRRMDIGAEGSSLEGAASHPGGFWKRPWDAEAGGLGVGSKSRGKTQGTDPAGG